MPLSVSQDYNFNYKGPRKSVTITIGSLGETLGRFIFADNHVYYTADSFRQTSLKKTDSPFHLL